jgi:hypothetical protein
MGGTMGATTTTDGAVSNQFHQPAAESNRESTKPSQSERPLHYKVICISMYNEDLQRLDTMVDTLKSRGITKANRSALIRHALSQVDLDKVPRGL